MIIQVPNKFSKKVTKADSIVTPVLSCACPTDHASLRLMDAERGDNN